jgi:hypothetical protein
VADDKESMIPSQPWSSNDVRRPGVSLWDDYAGEIPAIEDPTACGSRGE